MKVAGIAPGALRCAPENRKKRSLKGGGAVKQKRTSLSLPLGLESQAAQSIRHSASAAEAAKAGPPLRPQPRAGGGSPQPAGRLTLSAPFVSVALKEREATENRPGRWSEVPLGLPQLSQKKQWFATNRRQPESLCGDVEAGGPIAGHSQYALVAIDRSRLSRLSAARRVYSSVGRAADS